MYQHLENPLGRGLARLVEKSALSNPEKISLVEMLSRLTPEAVAAAFVFLAEENPRQILTPDQVVGIQGGEASFNAKMLRVLMEEQQVVPREIEYLFRTEAVLAALGAGEIDLGLFAIANSLGGMVEETQMAVEADLGFEWEILRLLRLPIRHVLMGRKDADLSQLTTVMAHPQVLKQCANNLQRKYSHLVQTSGEGDLIDTDRAAQEVATGGATQIAILGNEEIARVHDLHVIERDLQDRDDNMTYFVLVALRSMGLV